MSDDIKNTTPIATAVAMSARRVARAEGVDGRAYNNNNDQ